MMMATGYGEKGFKLVSKNPGLTSSRTSNIRNGVFHMTWSMVYPELALHLRNFRTFPWDTGIPIHGWSPWVASTVKTDTSRYSKNSDLYWILKTWLSKSSLRLTEEVTDSKMIFSLDHM